MNHRRGQRWLTELPIRISPREAATPLPAQLLEWSYHGAYIHLLDWVALPGEVIGVWLPDRDTPIQAVVVHAGNHEAGLLWIDRSAWQKYLLDHPIPQFQQGPISLAC